MDKNFSAEDINKLRKIKTLNSLYGMMIYNHDPLMKAYRSGYIQAIDDLLVCMIKAYFCDDLDSPELWTFWSHLRTTADYLVEELNKYNKSL